MSRPFQRRLDFDPLERRAILDGELVDLFATAEIRSANGRRYDTKTDRNLADALGVSRRVLYRWREDGVPIDTADTVATRLGYHPVHIWGDEWFDDDQLAVTA